MVTRSTFLLSFATFVLIAGFSTDSRGSEIVADLDFRLGAHGWTGNTRVAGLAVTPEGLRFECTGADPWIEGPPMDLPEDRRARLTLRMKSTGSGNGELFHGPEFVAGRSAAFRVTHDGEWQEYVVALPPLGPGCRLRLDPCSAEGLVTVASLRIEALPSLIPPDWPTARPYRTVRGFRLRAVSGDLVWEQSDGWGNFRVLYGDMPLAEGYSGSMAALDAGGGVEWRPVPGNAARRLEGATGVQVEGVIEIGGAALTVTRVVRPGAHAGTLDGEVRLQSNRPVEVWHFPWLEILAGHGSFGPHKQQGLFAGLEYLADEPSSSTADISGPAHDRRAPDPVKITFPLMAIAADDHYLALLWNRAEPVTAAFDSPDRVYGSEAHLMALWGPRFEDHRGEGLLYADAPFTVEADRPIEIAFTLAAGPGDTVAPAIQRYVALRGWPDPPDFEGGFDRAVRLLAHGWLDTPLHEDGTWRHAVWGSSFAAHPAGDAVAFLRYLANHTADDALAGRLRAAADRGLERLAGGDGIPRDADLRISVSHVHPFVAPLLHARGLDAVHHAVAHARSLGAAFGEDGLRRYRQAEGGPDYARTHDADHANGYAAAPLRAMLEAASLSGDADLERRALQLLDANLAAYAGGVPRGAQTWEVPLHTPDILASAHLCRAAVYGYELTGDPAYLDAARDWAWTGVPFVYLDQPASGAVGPYSTIAVYGATSWVAPVWFGLPVQWCGLVYADALYALAGHDPEGPWLTLARGITLTGLNMSWPEGHGQGGLLPDFYSLREQIADGPAINPGTIQARLGECFNQPPLYQFHRLPENGWRIHAPCAVDVLRDATEEVRIRLGGFGGDPYTVLIAGVAVEPGPVVYRGGRGLDTRWDAPSGLLTLRMEGPATVIVAPGADGE